MNQWILLFSLILGLGGTGCENREPGIITIMGEIKGLPEGWVRLYTCPPSNLLLDSCEIREGKYKLKGKLDDPQLGMLFFDVKPEYQPNFMPMVRLFLQPTIMKVYSEREDMKGSLKVENAPLNEQLIACEKFLKRIQAGNCADRFYSTGILQSGYGKSAFDECGAGLAISGFDRPCI